MFSFFRNACFILTLLISPGLLAQNPAAKRDTVFCDCEKARDVIIKPGAKVGLTVAPPGEGEKIEISAHRLQTPYSFEKEHHSAWYKLKITVDGMMSFDLTPEIPEDDYDFMLYQSGKNNFCDSLAKNKLKPVRANISRDKNELKGKTGLSLTAKKELVKEGVNDAYALSIPVKKGEEYYLIVDNVYENGGGHTIVFFYEIKVNIKGVVRDEEQKVVVTNVTVTDVKGNVVAETNTDRNTGAYTIATVLKRNGTYSLNYYNDSSFVFSKTIVAKDTQKLRGIQVVLPRLKKGKKYSIGAINFYGGLPEYIPASEPAMNNLYKLMKRNPLLKIQIEGHTNGCAPYVMGLSTARAEKIKEYLTKHGVDAERIQTLGRGCEEMLYPNPTDPWQEEQNRRVEIKVLEF